MDLLLLVVLLALSALFSGSETALFSLRPVDLAQLSTEKGGGPRVAGLVADAHSLLTALLVGNLLVNTAASVLATALCLAWFGPSGLAVAVPFVTLSLLIFGEITPKMLALRFRRPLALHVQRPLSGWVWICRPLLRILGTGTERLLRLLPWERTGTRPLKTAELETACDLAVDEGSLVETEGRFLARLLLLQDLEVRQIMTPRPEVVVLHRSWPREEILAAARDAGFNRYPVVPAAGERPIGLFHLKDLLDQEGARTPLAAGLRELPFVPESKDVAALLMEMRTGVTLLVGVVDEHGDFVGIVTLADCLHALMGPVGDPGSPSEEEVFQLGPATWVLGGRLDLREVHEVCGVTLPVSRDYVTLAGFIMARLGRIPRPGDRLESSGARFTVLEMEGHKIVRVQVDSFVATGQEERQ